MSETGVTAPQGFSAAATRAGIKPSGKPDVAIVVNEGPEYAAAAVFTRNKVFAAPVKVSREAVAGGALQAVVAPGQRVFLGALQQRQPALQGLAAQVAPGAAEHLGGGRIVPAHPLLAVQAQHALRVRGVERPELPGGQLAFLAGVEDGAHRGVGKRGLPKMPAMPAIPGHRRKGRTSAYRNRVPLLLR